MIPVTCLGEHPAPGRERGRCVGVNQWAAIEMTVGTRRDAGPRCPHTSTQAEKGVKPCLLLRIRLPRTEKL